LTRNKSKGPKRNDFRNKLLLNQWLVSLFGIDSLAEQASEESMGAVGQRTNEVVRRGIYGPLPEEALYPPFELLFI
jgi:hypothetical protein